MRNLAMGPLTRPPITRPKVADAMAKVRPPTAPFCSIIGAKAADDPTPPIREIEPAHMPSRGFKRNARAIATPHTFCIISMTEEVQNNIKIAIPPFLIILRLALNPMVEKNAIMKKSFNVWSNAN